MRSRFARALCIEHLSDMLLFRARSFIETLPRGEVVFRDVAVHWFHVGAREASRPYERLIDGYNALDEPQRAYARRHIDELFTAQEVEQLRRYLDRLDTQTVRYGTINGQRLHADEAVLPLPGGTAGYTDHPVGGTADVYRLAEHDGYDLPFAVYGYFDLSMPWLGDKIEQSVDYLRRALQSLGVDAGIKQAQVRAVADRLYQRSRLYVAQETTHQNWLDKVDLDPQDAL